MGRKRKVTESDKEESETDGNNLKKRVTRGGGKKKSFRDLAFRDMDSSSDEEDPNICPVCNERNDPRPVDNKNRMVGCDGICEKWFHWSCVGMNQSNKPGKDDDWFCRKCSGKKTEASEWKPIAGDEEGLKVDSSPAVKTPGQRKLYDSAAECSKRGRGRPVGGKNKNVQTPPREPLPVQRPRESWSTAKSSSVPSTSTPTPPPAAELSQRLPPGISVSKSSQAHSQNTEKSPSESDCSESHLKNLPGVSISKEGEECGEDTSCENSFLTDLLQNGSSPSEEDITARSNLPSTGIKLTKLKEKSPVEKKGLRVRGEQVAKIIASLEEENSDDRLFGEKRMVYKKPAKPSPIKEIEPTTIDELLKDVDDGEDTNLAKRHSQNESKIREPAVAQPSKKQTDTAIVAKKYVRRNVFTLEKIQNSGQSLEEGTEKEIKKDEGDTSHWECVEDETGKKGLSLITKTSNSIVIKPYSVKSDAESDESNENSSSRPKDTENENLLVKTVDNHPENIENNKNEEMEPVFPDISSLEDVLNPSKSSIQSQKDEAEIQKIKHNLDADFEGTVPRPAAGCGSMIQQRPSPPVTRATHQLPQTILQTASGAFPLSTTASPTSPSKPSVSGGLLSEYSDGDKAEQDKNKKVSIMVLEPGQLNLKATDGLSAGPSPAQKITAITPTKILVQNPAIHPTRQQDTSPLQQPPQLLAHNRLQGPQFQAQQQLPQMPPALRISQPSNNGVLGLTSNGSVPVMSQPLLLVNSSTGLTASSGKSSQSPGSITGMLPSPRLPLPVVAAGTGMPPSPRHPLQVAGAGTGLPPSPRHPLPVAGGGSGMSPSPRHPLQAGAGTGMPPSPRHPLQVAGASSPRSTPSPRGRGRGTIRVRGPRPGGRGMRPRGPPPPGMRLVRPGGPVRGMRVRGPRPPVRPPSSVPPPQQQVTAPVPMPKPLKVECIDVSSDEDEPAPPPAKSATLQRLNSLGISVSRQKAPQIPEGVVLPPGISLSAPGSSSSLPSKRSSSQTSYNGESSRKRVSVDSNVASALSSVATPARADEPKQKVELELNSKQMEALKALGLL